MSAVIPCFAQKSSISCVSLTLPTSLPPTSLRPDNRKKKKNNNNNNNNNNKEKKFGC
jgi:hypothetical protein